MDDCEVDLVIVGAGKIAPCEFVSPWGDIGLTNIL